MDLDPPLLCTGTPGAAATHHLAADLLDAANQLPELLAAEYQHGGEAPLYGIVEV
jgi:hypothetical protein